MTSLSYRSLACAAAITLLATPRSATAQTPAALPGRTVTVIPGPDYDAGALTRKLLGDGWRNAWLTPIDVPVLDLDRHDGALKVTRSGGGNQSRTLHFVQSDGWREHVFRSVNKFPVGQAMPAAIHNTPLGDIIADNVSSLFPAGALMVPTFLGALGILHVKPALYMMPNDPRLGVYRDTFALMLGTMELSPQEAPEDKPGFADSKKITNGEDFLKDVQASRKHRLDERELLAVRLVDFLVNDTDRSADNMRFVRYDDDSAFRWRPLPRDRDRAFVDAGGWVFKHLVKPVYPKLIDFGHEYRLAGLTFESHNLDRRLLQRLDRNDVDEVAKRVQTAVTDRVIDDAIASLPAPWRTATDADERLRTNLKQRRNAIPEIARDFYEWLATEVDVHGSDEIENVEVLRHTDGRVTVTVAGDRDSAGVLPFSRRTFLPDETNEVRVYLHDGDDVATVRGKSSNAIEVRIIGGGGDDILADSAGGKATSLYDDRGDNDFVTAKGTRVSIQEWNPPKQGAGIRLDAPWRPDWGRSTSWSPALGYDDGAGVIVGFGPRYKSHGFRRLPHRWEMGANLLMGLGNGRPGLSASADYRAENSPLALTFDARATKFETFRFYGFGNDTRDENTGVARVREDVVAFEPSVVWQIGWRSREGLGGGIGDGDGGFPGLRPLIGNLKAGPVVYWTRPHPAVGSPFAAVAEQGLNAEGRVGMRVGLDLDRTNGGTPSSSGWRMNAELAGFPPLWDVDQSFSTAVVTGSVYVPLSDDGPNFAVRVGGAFASGGFLVQHAPALGGRETLRGYSPRRFTGESSTYGSAEIRVPVGSVPLFVNWQSGVFGLVDVGRVWFEDRNDGGWHAGAGAGVWLSALGQTFSVAVVRGEENRVYLQRGMFF